MRAVVLCAVVFVSGCGSSPAAPFSTSSPAPSPSPSPPPPTAPAATSFRVTGVVTDDTGTPLGGLPLRFEFAAGDFASVPELPCNSFCTISTDAAGGYDLRFQAIPISFSGSPLAAGLVRTDRAGYQHNAQLLPLRADIVLPIRLRRLRVVNAGDPFTSIIEPDSSTCTGEDLIIWTHRCDFVQIAAQSTGTLVVDARDGTGGGPVPLVFFTAGDFTTAQNAGTGVVSVGVRVGQKYTVAVGAPVQMPPAQRYDVKTFMAQEP